MHQSFRIERLLSESAAEGSPPCSMTTRRKRSDWSIGGGTCKQKLVTTPPNICDQSNGSTELDGEHTHQTYPLLQTRPPNVSTPTNTHTKRIHSYKHTHQTYPLLQTRPPNVSTPTNTHTKRIHSYKHTHQTYPLLQTRPPNVSTPTNTPTKRIHSYKHTHFVSHINTRDRLLSM